MRAIAILSVIAWGTSVAAEPLVFDAEKIRSSFGVFCEVETDGRQIAPGTVEGAVDIYTEVPQFLWNSKYVPAYPGMSFGVQTFVQGTETLLDITVKLTHPPFLESGATEQVYVTSMAGDGAVSINAYTFDYPEELVRGTWTLETIHEGETLYRMEFEVIDPALLPQMTNVCAGEFLS